MTEVMMFVVHSSFKEFHLADRGFNVDTAVGRFNVLSVCDIPLFSNIIV